MIELYNEDCFKTMSLLDKNSIDVVLTSPFYNTNKKAGDSRTLLNSKVKSYAYTRYDKHVDNMTNEEYCDFTEKLFNEFDRILNANGCVLYNISYGSENTECMFKAVNRIIEKTQFTIADVITWKKKSAVPNNVSKNKLTRITEFVFVFCRREEFMSFYMNKEIKSYRKTGQACYENMFNFIEAKNNDGACEFNKATYSSELCEKLLKMYAPEDSFIYDPFIGTGTTAVACERLGLHCVGSEISSNQVKFAVDRLYKEFDYLEGNEDALYYELNEQAAS